MPDKLETMMILQRNLMDVLNIPRPGGKAGHPGQEIAFLHDKLATAIMMEGAELKDWAPWKHWSGRSGNKLVEPDDLYNAAHLEEILEEVIDILHFTLEVAILFGWDADDLERAFVRKATINLERHEQHTKGEY